MKRTFMKQSLAALALLGAALGAAAQGTAFPAKTLNYVVPYPPGGTTDIIGRTLAQRLGPALGSTVIVDNKAGATGTIGGAFVARAPADGNTLLGTSIGPQAIVPHLMPSVPYDAARAYAPVLLVGTVPHLLVVAAASPYKTVAELLAAAKARPGELSFASGGNGTILQMQGELLRLHAGVEMIHVPYKGDTPALQDVMGGQATFVFAPIAAALPQVQAGKLRALAITAAQRATSLPQVPTMAEAGVKDFVVEQWQAVYAPAGTPVAVVQRLNQELNQILKDREVVASFDRLGVAIVGGTPQQLAERQKADSERWGRVIKTAGIKLD
jgi:tripartite-type tricarboxylate transporter receptor subunit TctC